MRRHGHAMKGFHPLHLSVVKMNEPFISLCPEITRAHALTLVEAADSSLPMTDMTPRWDLSA